MESSWSALCAWARDPLARRLAGDLRSPDPGPGLTFIALHEIGHLVGKGRSAPPRVGGERLALRPGAHRGGADSGHAALDLEAAAGYGVLATASTAGSCLGSLPRDRLLAAARAGADRPGPTMLSVVELKQVAGRPGDQRERARRSNLRSEAFELVVSGRPAMIVAPAPPCSSVISFPPASVFGGVDESAGWVHSIERCPRANPGDHRGRLRLLALL